MNLIEKIKKTGLCGRGGAGFSTGQKWEMVREAQGEKKYVIANGSEGEPGVFKDSYIIEKHPEMLIEGVALALQSVGADTGIIYLRKDLYEKYKEKLEGIIQKSVPPRRDTGGVQPQNKLKSNHDISDLDSRLRGNDKKMEIKILREDGGYLCGEETTLLNSIEKKRNEPRLKPPFPTNCGLYQCPTLINNIETFYRVAEIAEDQYHNKRFYSLSGFVKHQGVFELDVDLTIEEVLRQTKNYPQTEFFVQAGGGGAGPVYTQAECKEKLLQGAGALIVHDIKENPFDLLNFWTDFFLKNSCGQCIPCREGFYRIHKMLKQAETQKLKAESLNYDLLKEILEVMADTSFCGLGQYAPEGYLDYMEKILKV